LNQICNFQQPKNPSLILFLFLFSALAHHYFFSYLSGSSHTFSHIFFTDPISTSDQPCIRPTDPISFDYLRPTAARRHLRPQWPPRHTLLSHPPPTPWSRLASSRSPLQIWPHPISFPFPSLVTRVIDVPPPLPPSP
jgi:hypothetical protein